MGGALSDLTTYTQWSWPQDGATAAYYGYDLNFEFVESYVNALYMAFTDGTIGDSLHFRCVDANNLHTLVVPVAIHVPSIPQQSALVGTAILVPLAQPIQPPSKSVIIPFCSARLSSTPSRSAQTSPSRTVLTNLPLSPTSSSPQAR